ncbi:MAG: hypothetical protein K0R54_527 [Clostridiaceae bacterium]|jgi:hypothetical protein|nr:hypothetical protein [Clostridiaceae bacterium]
MSFKNYNEIEQWFIKQIPTNSGVYIETEINNETKILHIFKLNGVYLHSEVCLNGIMINTMIVGFCEDLFPFGAKSVEIISESDVIFKLGGIGLLKKYNRHQKLIEILNEKVDYKCLSENEIIEILRNSGLCPTEEGCKENTSCSECWKIYLDKEA